MPQRIVDDEANQRMAVHDQAFLCSARFEVRFRLAGERGVVALHARIVIRVDKDGVKRRGVLLASADHNFALHLLFGFFGNLDW